MTKYAIIVAGGTGSRMGSNLPKQFMLIKDKPVLYYSIKTFLDAYDDSSDNSRFTCCFHRHWRRDH